MKVTFQTGRKTNCYLASLFKSVPANLGWRFKESFDWPTDLNGSEYRRGGRNERTQPTPAAKIQSLLKKLQKSTATKRKPPLPPQGTACVQSICKQTTSGVMQERSCGALQYMSVFHTCTFCTLRPPTYTQHNKTPVDNASFSWLTSRCKVREE